MCLCLQLTGLAMQVFMLYYGRLFIQRGQMTTGNLVSFILYQSDLGDNIRVYFFSFYQNQNYYQNYNCSLSGMTGYCS